ncbi:replication protein A 70 kDa DNA-binding subunit A [Striga asiatica]|uniref:Replication protein A 70 kDa DNA-binding subunit A n=1 Tax=Striga asiatica TaxID=4170 RepID=A0A5A7Q2E9_STRAF|nr:replication protein A 70 kDa DNA-binding subunit A [Striga asiatica]
MAKAWGNIKQVTRTNMPMLKLRVVRVFQRTNEYSSYKNILEIVFHDIEGGQITGIVRAVNIPTFKDEFEEEKVQVTSSKDITRPIAGENIPDIVEFRNRAAVGPLKRARLISKRDVIVKSELQELADGDIVVSDVDSLCYTAGGNDIWVCATVESIIDEWWYHSCRRCTSKMEEVHGHYKIQFGVQDSSALATLIAWNNECEPIIGRPCDALRREIMQKVRIRQNRRNFNGAESAFSVVRMIADENLVSKYSQWITEKEDCIGEEEVSTPVKSLKGKEKVGETSNTKKKLMEIIEDEAGFVAQSATADKGKAKVTEQDDEMKDNFD